MFKSSSCFQASGCGSRSVHISEKLQLFQRRHGRVKLGGRESRLGLLAARRYPVSTKTSLTAWMMSSCVAVSVARAMPVPSSAQRRALGIGRSTAGRPAAEQRRALTHAAAPTRRQPVCSRRRTAGPAWDVGAESR